MKYKPDWEKTQQKFIEYWNMENHERPIIAISGKKEVSSKKNITIPEKIIDRWMDFDYVIESTRAHFESTYFGAEAFPNFCPNLGPDIFGAILGDDIEFGEATSWSKHKLESWENVKKFEFDKNNYWWKKILELTQAVVDDSNGDYFVGITDLHPGADGLVSLRGPENLSLDLFDYPNEVKKANFECFEVFKQVFDELYRITTKKQPGSSNWMGIWHPNKWYVTSCDFMGMISKDMYKEFVEEELLMEINWLDASIFHLDGPGALRHLDSLLEIGNLKGVQWVYGAGQPTAAHWIDVLKKIQNAGKLIQISAYPSDIKPLLEQLKPEGLMLNIYPDSDLGREFTEQEAKDIISMIEKFKK